MPVHLHIPTPLRRHTNGQRDLTLSGSTVGEVLEKLVEQHPDISSRLFTDGNRLNRFVNIYVNEEDIRFLGNLDTPVREGDTLSLVLAVAGGASIAGSFNVQSAMRNLQSTSAEIRSQIPIGRSTTPLPAPAVFHWRVPRD